MLRWLGLMITLAASGRTWAHVSLEKIRLPKDFSIELYAQAPGARSLALSPKGTLFVGTRSQGVVYAITAPSGTQPAQVFTLASKLDSPNGVAFRDGALYVAELSRLLRFDQIEDHLKDPPKPVVIYDGLPKDEAHGWKFIRFAPDGKLYVPVGAPCNICERSDPRYASILRLEARPGQVPEIFARGIRNTVGFDWHPDTHELWFTDNGRDLMGDDVPPDELNRAPRSGMHFGFPYCHGGDVLDPQFGRGHKCSESTPPERKLGPHVAALGMRFYTGSQFPENYRGRIFIAEHGSWNRSRPIGYRLTMVTLKNGHAAAYEPFAEGWLQGNKAWGRPVDLEIASDGSLFVSDDESGSVYRIRYKKGTP